MARTFRIQIVEDQYFVAMDCERVLRAAGFECTGLAANAAQAIDLALRDRPDLILMDIRLTGSMDGIDAALSIFRESGIRCLFSSAHADRTVRERAAAARPLGWIEKPFTCEQLIGAVQRATGTIQASPEA